MPSTEYFTRWINYWEFFLVLIITTADDKYAIFCCFFFSLCLVEGKCLWCYKNTFCVIKSFAPCDILRNFTRWPQHVRSLANIRDFKERLRTVLVRWPEVIFFHHSSTDTTTAIAVKTSVKSVFAFFFILYRDYSNSLTLSNVCERLRPCSEPPRQGNVKKKKFIKKGDSWANSGLPCGVLSVLSTPRGAMISVMKSSFPSTVFCVYIWLYFSLNGCRAWHRNLRLMIEEWTVDSEISKDDQKRIKWVYLAILFQIYTGVLRT